MDYVFDDVNSRTPRSTSVSYLKYVLFGMPAF